jgi:hypothetical protein
MVVAQQRAGQFEKVRVAARMYRVPQSRELEIDVAEQFFLLGSSAGSVHERLLEAGERQRTMGPHSPVSPQPIAVTPPLEAA